MNMASTKLHILQEKVWQGSIPLHISLSPVDCRTYNDSLPYMVRITQSCTDENIWLIHDQIHFPRLSYLPFLLARLHAFFSAAFIDPATRPHKGWFSCQGVALKWQHPVGLLYDLFAGSEPSFAQASQRNGQPYLEHEGDQIRLSTTPWKLTLHYSDWPVDQLIPLDASEKVQHDAFVNSVKEADFLRNGTGKIMMSLSKDDSTKLWQAVQKHNLALFNAVNHKFLHPPGGLVLRHVPIKVYLPSTARSQDVDKVRATIRVVQGLVAPFLPTNEPQTLVMALHSLLPTVFPSRRSYIYAQAVMHGAVLPAAASIHDLMIAAAFPDGFLHIAISMIN